MFKETNSKQDENYFMRLTVLEGSAPNAENSAIPGVWYELGVSTVGIANPIWSVAGLTPSGSISGSFRIDFANAPMDDNILCTLSGTMTAGG